jgi:hypothetical protein
MRALSFALVLSFVTFSAHAATLNLSCQRYESKCKGEKCYDNAARLKQDKEKKIFTMQHMENINYAIREDGATATFDDAKADATLVNGKYTLEFKYVTQDDAKIVLENKTDTGVVKEQVNIDKLTGFYAKYLLHTDGSLKDVPIGEPYSAYFGWCEDMTNQPPAAPQPPETAKP